MENYSILNLKLCLYNRYYIFMKKSCQVFWKTLNYLLKKLKYVTLLTIKYFEAAIYHFLYSITNDRQITNNLRKERVLTLFLFNNILVSSYFVYAWYVFHIFKFCCIHLYSFLFWFLFYSNFSDSFKTTRFMIFYIFFIYDHTI